MGSRTCKSMHFILFLLCLVMMSGQAMALTVKDVRIGLHPDKTRLVIDLDEMSKFRTFVLDSPWRLVIDLPDFNWQAGAISKPKASAVSGIRQGPLQPGISRIVIDLKRPVSISNAFLLRANGNKPDRLVIDFIDITESAFQAEKDKMFGILDVDNPPQAKTIQERSRQAPAATNMAPPVPAQPPAQRYTPPPPQQTTQLTTAPSDIAIPAKKPAALATAPPPITPQPAKRPLIVLDPGHGGVDPGAIGINGIFEKHVALSMAKELKQMLENTGRYDVILTRDRDIYKRLYQRVEIARAHNADLFISLHADSIGKSNVSGASIYTLSEKASDQQTARLAERENKADIIAGIDISHEDEQVADILISLAMRDTMNHSKSIANTLVDSMERGDIKILDKPHRSAGFAVLKAPDIPSVLIEIGFMSNKNEAQMLARADYRRKIAQALVYGIDAYFEKVRRNNRI